MPEVISKLETNVKSHVDQTRSTCSKEVATLKKAAGELKALKPAQALTTVIADSVGNLADGLKGQAEIVRRWV